MNEINTENINQIDLSIDHRFLDDEDTSFGSINLHTTDMPEISEDRNFERKTGIIIDLSDDDIELKTPRKIIANLDDCNNGIKISTDFAANQPFTSDTYNEIDMETEYFDDEDDDLVTTPISKETELESDLIKFDNDDTKNLNEASTNAEVTRDYWKNLAKKHAASNKKGAYNTHFHLSGNPKLEQELFNQAMGSSIDGTKLTSAQSTNIVGTDGVGEGSFGESLNTSTKSLNEYSKKLKDLINILNLELLVNSDNSYTLLDLYDDTTEYICKDFKELAAAMQTYMEDFFIYPLQISTGVKLNTCKEWVDWYNNLNDDKYKEKYASDIAYCDLIANHLEDCTVEDLI